MNTYHAPGSGTGPAPKNPTPDPPPQPEAARTLADELPAHLGAYLSDAEREARAKSLKQQGFQICQLHGLAGFTVLEGDAATLRQTYQAIADDADRQYKNALRNLERKTRDLDDRITALAAVENVHTAEKGEYKAKIQKIEGELDTLRTQLTDVKEQFAEVKKHAGSRLVTEAEQELHKVLQLQEEVQEKALIIGKRARDTVAPVSGDIMEKWKRRRADYAEQQDDVMAKIKHLASFGITASVAYVLVSIGSAMAGAAGFFFSIFTSKTDYSSNDIFSSLLLSVVNTAGAEGSTPLEKAGYLIGGLFVITVVSFGIFKWLRKISNYHEAGANEDVVHRFEASGQGESFGYRMSTGGNSWFTLWLKAVPILLVAGLALIALCSSSLKGKDIQEINTSTEGVVIGTSIAMGLAGMVYLYLTKIIEVRETQRSLLLQNKELILGICILLLAIASFAFYRARRPEDTGMTTVEAYSIAAFIGTCFAAAFPFAYGMRFIGLRAANTELENHIVALDRFIIHNSTAMPLQLDLNLEIYFDVLGKSLGQRVLDKNTHFHQGPEARTAELDVKPNENVFQYIARLFKEIVKSSKKKADPTKEPELFSMAAWEAKYFPEWAERINTLALLHATKNKELAEALAQLAESKKEEAAFRTETETKIAGLRQEIEQVHVEEARIQRRRAETLARLTQECEQALVHLREGFDLGRWYNRYPAWPPPPPRMIS